MANLAIAPFVSIAGAVDYLAVTPDMFWIDHGSGVDNRDYRFTDIPSWVNMLYASGLPMVSHHIGLSITSAIPTDRSYVAQMARWAGRWRAHWLSEHLAFVSIAEGHGASAAGLALTAPFDNDVLSLAVERARYVIEQTRAPFLLENSPYFVNFDDSEMTEA